MQSTIQKLSVYLNGCFVERSEIIKGMLVALVARQHVLLIGPPGTAKSALVHELASCLTGVSYFQWLLTQFSTPEELFGPVSLQALENGVFKRNTQGKLPEAHIGFADEIFKANSAILNSILTLINERVFHNNGNPTPVPLISLFGASNEYPEQDEGLEALFDRFLLCYEVKPVAEDQQFRAVLRGASAGPRPQVPMEEIIMLQQAIQAVSIPEEIFDIYVELRKQLAEEEIRPSDRRWRQSLDLIRASAAIRESSQVAPSDLNILKAVLWEQPEQRQAVAAAVARYTTDKFLQEINSILQEAQEIAKTATEAGSTEAGTEANKKIKSLLHELEEIKTKHPSKQAQVDETWAEVKKLNGRILEICLGI